MLLGVAFSLSRMKNSLRHRASSLLGLQGTKSSAAAPPPLPYAFLEGSASEVEDRRHLLHQEAVAGIIQAYAGNLERVVNELAQIHEALSSSLKEAGDLVAKTWVMRVDALAHFLRDYAEATRRELAGATKMLKAAHEEHLRTAQLLVNGDRAKRRREHYETKVEQLRVDARTAASGLTPGALDPETSSEASAPSPSMRSYTGLKTMQADLKLGRLVRNEEKLSRMVERHERIDADAASALERCLTVSRRRLREALDDLIRRALQDFLPGIQNVLSAAEAAAETAETQNRTPEALCAFAAGERLVIEGLASSPEYNCQVVTVQAERPDGRVEVILRNEEDGYLNSSSSGAASSPKILALKSENLSRRPIPADPQTSGPYSDVASHALLRTGIEWLGIHDAAASENSGDSSDGV